MTASSPITMDDLVNGLVFIQNNGNEWRVQDTGAEYCLVNGSDRMNIVDISSDGLTIRFSDGPSQGPNFTGFTFNA